MQQLTKADFPQSTVAPKSSELSRNEESEETLEEKREKLRIRLGLGSLSHTFENFKVVVGVEKALKAFKEMAGEVFRPMLLVYGGLGNGKTYLCEALSIALYRRGTLCQVSLWAELRRQLLQAMHRPKPGRMDYDNLFESIRRREKLIIDDIGMGSTGTAWEMSELEDITNYRYREKMFTVFTTNRPLEELPERVTSRFSDPEVSNIVLNEAKDYRKRQI